MAPQSAIGLLAQLGSLAGTVIVLGKVVMNLLERAFPTSRNRLPTDTARCAWLAAAFQACCKASKSAADVKMSDVKLVKDDRAE